MENDYGQVTGKKCFDRNDDPENDEFNAESAV